MTSLPIADLRPGDLDRLLEFYRSLTPQVTSLFTPFPVADRETLARHLDESSRGLHLSMGLFDGELIVGHGFISRIADANPVLAIGIARAYQGRGDGRRLTSALLDRYDRRFQGAITLTVLKSNRRAVSLYESHGFAVRSDHTFLAPNDSHLMVRAHER